MLEFVPSNLQLFRCKLACAGRHWRLCGAVVVCDSVAYWSVGGLDLSDRKVVVEKSSKLIWQLWLQGGADGSVEGNNTLNVKLCEQLVILDVDQ